MLITFCASGLIECMYKNRVGKSESKAKAGVWAECTVQSDRCAANSYEYLQRHCLIVMQCTGMDCDVRENEQIELF